MLKVTVLVQMLFLHVQVCRKKHCKLALTCYKLPAYLEKG